MSFTPYKNEKRKVSILLENKTVMQLDRVAMEIDISRNEIISQCIDYALEHFVNNDMGNENKTTTLNEKLSNNRKSKNDKNVTC